MGAGGGAAALRDGGAVVEIELTETGLGCGDGSVEGDVPLEPALLDRLAREEGEGREEQFCLFGPNGEELDVGPTRRTSELNYKNAAGRALSAREILCHLLALRRGHEGLLSVLRKWQDSK